jgi:photosystem II stability/assembly factor-like uncharacterized protein
MTVVMVVALSLLAAAFNVAWSSAASAQIQAAKATSHAKTISFDLAGATLEQFTPITSRTWWAVVEGDNSGSDVVRTGDSGQHWEDVWTSPTGAIASSDFLNGEVGWIVDWVEQGSANPPPSEPLYRTVDGGQSWQRLVNVPNGCQLDFVDPLHGWCVLIGAAAGSAGFDLYGTINGGSTWSLASSTGPNDSGSTPDHVPFGCDKAIHFTSRSVGWLSSLCNGGAYYLLVTQDAGSQWARSEVPLPSGTTTLDYGSQLGEPVAVGARVALSVQIDGPTVTTETTAIATSTNGGMTWKTQVVPDAHGHWSVDLVTPSVWILSDGRRLMATDDAGVHWRSWVSPVKMADTVGEVLTLHFLTARTGWAVPSADGGPFWWTTDGGAEWRPILVDVGPYKVPAS